MGFSNKKKALLLCLLLLAAVFPLVSAVSGSSEPPQRHRRLLLLEDAEIEEDEVVMPTKKKTTTSSFTSSKNKEKALKPPPSSSGYTIDKPVKNSPSSTKNQTKLIKPISGSLKNKTKSIKSTADGNTLEKTKLKKLNSISNSKTIKSTDDLLTSKAEGDGYSSGKSKLKKLNSTSMASSDSKTPSSSSNKKKPSDLLKTSSSSKNKTSKSSTDDKTQLATAKINKKKENNEVDIKHTTQEKNSDQNQKQKKKTPTLTATTKTTTTKGSKKQQIPKNPSQPSWIYSSDDDDLISEFRDLPTKFHQTFIPDLQKISSSSKIYFSKANKEITKGFKPYVGNKYAPTIATTISFFFIIIPFLLVSLIFHRIKAFFSLQKLLIFIQVYLAIYFTILCLSALVTGLEPLGFFYSTSRSTYVGLQVLQSLGYVLYLLLLLMYLVLVFSTDSGLGSKFVGLAQTLVGFAIGLHYYVTVFHRVVLRQPPKTNWKVHAVYATCFVVICLLARADRRKKTYLGEGGEEDKRS